MITSWDIYWITRLDSILTIIVSLFVICVVALVPALMITVIEEAWKNARWPQIKRAWRAGIIAMTILGVLAAMTPSTKEAVAIYMIPKIANNEQVQKLPDNAMTFLNKKLEEWIKEMVKKDD